MLEQAQNGREPFARSAGHVPRRQREARRASLQAATTRAIATAEIAVVLLAIAPRTKPLVTIYMPSDCVTCVRWMEHLAARGFRTEIGDMSEWSAVRAEFALPPGSLSSHTAVVDGMFIEGPVPAREIHLALEWRAKYHIRGLVVPGVPRGSPAGSRSCRNTIRSSLSATAGSSAIRRARSCEFDARAFGAFLFSIAIESIASTPGASRFRTRLSRTDLLGCHLVSAKFARGVSIAPRPSQRAEAAPSPAQS